jgi:5'-methylthioadenosine phosphorylase
VTDAIELGVFGGSGFYRFLESVEERVVETPFGAPSDAVMVGKLGGRGVAFLPRHGRHHQTPAQAVNYRANVWAMKSLGVRRILAPCAVGSLQPQLHPGDFVLTDQFVDRTRGRADTFYNGPRTVHVSAADPYCPELRALALAAAQDLGIRAHARGTVVTVQGPRFSTRAESRWFAGLGWEVIGMTQYPEVILARELEMCYLNICLVTDYDVGVEHDASVAPVSAHAVREVVATNVTRVRELITLLVPKISPVAGCACQRALADASLS